MNTLLLEVSAMYGDHHVAEVRRILLALPGVEDVTASSAFHTVEVSFNAEAIAEDTIAATLDKAGYLEDLLVPLETGAPAISEDTNGKTYFRHSAAHEATGNVMSFGQQVAHSGRALWPCPGMSPVLDPDE